MTNDTMTLEQSSKYLRDHAQYFSGNGYEEHAHRMIQSADAIDAHLAKESGGVEDVAVARVISGYEFGDHGPESKVAWLYNPMPEGAELYEYTTRPKTEWTKVGYVEISAMARLLEGSHQSETLFVTGHKKSLPVYTCFPAKQPKGDPVQPVEAVDERDSLLREVRANSYACYLAGKCDQKGFQDRIDAALDHPHITSREAKGEKKTKLIGWRMADYTAETDDIEKARNWAPNVTVLPIFEGDPNTSLPAAKEAAKAGCGVDERLKKVEAEAYERGWNACRNATFGLSQPRDG